MMHSQKIIITTIRSTFSKEEVANALYEALATDHRLTGSPALDVEVTEYGFVLVQKHEKASAP